MFVAIVGKFLVTVESYIKSYTPVESYIKVIEWKNDSTKYKTNMLIQFA